MNRQRAVMMAASDGRSTSRKPPPFVLVHGAFHGGWCWLHVARILRAAGHDVYTPTQTGLGERKHLMSPDISMDTFVADVQNVIETENLFNVVLVGHSYGGRSISGVADRIPERIDQLIYLDGGLPIDGRSRLDSMQPAARAERLAAADAFDGGISVPPPPPARFGIIDADQQAWLARCLSPQPLGAERTALHLKHPLGNGCPVTYIHCVNPIFSGTRESADYARSRADWTFKVFPASHDAMISHPAQLAELLLASLSNHSLSLA